MYPFLIPALYIFTATHLILPAFSNAFWYALNMFVFLHFFGGCNIPIY